MGNEPEWVSRLGEVEAIYRGRLRELHRVAAAVSGDRQAAPDLVQEAFVLAVRELSRFRGDGPLDGWLWRIVVNVSKNHHRGKRMLDELPAELPGRFDGDASGRLTRVSAAVTALPERQRLVLFLRYYADLDYAAISDALEVSPGTVGATLNAARTSLEQALRGMEAVK